MPFNVYYNPDGIEGIGSDIRWCQRWTTGKRCYLCKNYASFEKWSKEWYWYYIMSWYYYSYKEYCHFNVSWRIYDIKPKNYRTKGLKEHEVKSLFKSGCKKDRKCKCVNIAQRAFWYCAECYNSVLYIAQQDRAHKHEVMLRDRNDLKEELLIARLAGILE